MRKVFCWCVAGCSIPAFIAAIVLFTPIRYFVLRKPLTENQYWILRRADLGLKNYATKSPTAAALYHQAQAARKLGLSLTVLAVPPDSLRGAAAFMDPLLPGGLSRTVAMYVHPLRSVCFIETNCDQKSYVSLGLTLGHELSHRQDFLAGRRINTDTDSSQATRDSEVRARIVETTILNEYTGGRWNQVVDRHIVAYHQLPQRKKRQSTILTYYFADETAWLIAEFGPLSAKDLDLLKTDLSFSVEHRAHPPRMMPALVKVVEPVLETDQLSSQ